MVQSGIFFKFFVKLKNYLLFLQQIKCKIIYIMNYVDYAIDWHDKDNNIQSVRNLTWSSAQKHCKMLLKNGVVCLEVYKIEHHYTKVYDYENYENRLDKSVTIIRNREDLERSKVPSEIKKQILELF